MKRIKAWAVKKYLKQSLHDVRRKDLPLLLVKRYNYGYSNAKAQYRKFFLKYLIQYNSPFLDKENFSSNVEFPNPF